MEDIDVFVAYSRNDQHRIAGLLDAIDNLKWSVWWDDKLQGGSNFRHEIQQRVETARCVIVIWSQESIKSDWVIDEAEIGKSNNRLIPVKIDDIDPPLGFGQSQVISLLQWENDKTGAANLNFSQLKESIREHLGENEDDRGNNPERIGIRADVLVDIIRDLDDSIELQDIFGIPVTKNIVIVADENDLRIEVTNDWKLSEERANTLTRVLNDVIGRNSI